MILCENYISISFFDTYISNDIVLIQYPKHIFDIHQGLVIVLFFISSVNIFFPVCFYLIYLFH